MYSFTKTSQTTQGCETQIHTDGPFFNNRTFSDTRTFFIGHRSSVNGHRSSAIGHRSLVGGRRSWGVVFSHRSYIQKVLTTPPAVCYWWRSGCLASIYCVPLMAWAWVQIPASVVRSLLVRYRLPGQQAVCALMAGDDETWGSARVFYDTVGYGTLILFCLF